MISRNGFNQSAALSIEEDIIKALHDL